MKIIVHCNTCNIDVVFNGPWFLCPDHNAGFYCIWCKGFNIEVKQDDSN